MNHPHNQNTIYQPISNNIDMHVTKSEIHSFVYILNHWVIFYKHEVLIYTMSLWLVLYVICPA